MFDFLHQWYPIAPLVDLDPEKPTAVTILGQRLVIWKPRQQSEYRVFFDRCPHRLAPLSEGRIDEQSDRLMCSYHGWEFDAEGSCQHIPQAENLDVERQRAHLCATVLPTRYAADLLWVWLDPTTTELAAQTPLPLSLQMDATKGFVWSSYVREVDYDWQTLVENILDPSHVPFAHHGLQGKRQMGKPLKIEMRENTRDIAIADITSGFPSRMIFQPPCRVEYEIPLGEHKQLGLLTYCIPVSPGKARLVAFFSRNFAQKASIFFPRWWEHLKIRNRVIDSDMMILQHQEYFLAQTQQSWKTAYKMPTAADRFVIEFRRWLDTYCDGKFPWTNFGITPAPVTIHEDRRQVMDRYTQHTRHCSSCRRAVERIKIAKLSLSAIGILLVMSATVLPDSIRFTIGLPLLIISTIAGIIAFGLHSQVEPKFYFEDYLHPDAKS